MKGILIILFLNIICVFLYGDGTPAEGSGTEEDPYIIVSLDNLLWLSSDQSLWEATSYYVQNQDINAGATENWDEGAGFSPIGRDWPFCGVYDGNEHVIDSLFINRPESYHVGLFGFVYEAEIKNLNLTNLSISGDSLVAGIAGKNKESIVNNCSVSGIVTGRMSTGGIAGWNLTSELNDCYAECDVTGYFGTGCLIGRSTYYSSISRCGAMGTVNGDWHTGGLSGVLHLTEVNNCYANCAIDGATYTGGFVGYSNAGTSISACYFTGTVMGNSYTGGFAGVNSEAEILYSVWNIETAGPSLGVGNNENGNYIEFYGKTNSEMQTISTYTDLNWDFAGESINGEEDIWNIDPEINEGFPYLCNVTNYVNQNDMEIIQPVLMITNYPNPFNPRTTFRFSVIEQGNIKLNIYNIKGQLVKNLIDDRYSPGCYQIIWDGDDQNGCRLNSGIYLYKIFSVTDVAHGKMLMLK